MINCQNCKHWGRGNIENIMGIENTTGVCAAKCLLDVDCDCVYLETYSCDCFEANPEK
jgi:hypothetical protein